MSVGCLARQNRKQCILNIGHSGNHRYDGRDLIIEPRCQYTYDTAGKTRCILASGHPGEHQLDRRDPVVDAVRQDLLSRSQVGIQKYGVTLERQDLTLRDWLQHAYEETLDTANYLKRSIMELDGAEPK